MRWRARLSVFFSLPTQRCFCIDMALDALLLSFLCLRRGVSAKVYARVLAGVFSLPTQRCFLATTSLSAATLLFSAYAEVFLEAGRGERLLVCFSLPTQRCFPPERQDRRVSYLFSAYAEVFPTQGVYIRSARSFLCLRRGVSRANTRLSTMVRFSLPTQRCFRVL